MQSRGLGDVYKRQDDDDESIIATEKKPSTTTKQSNQKLTISVTTDLVTDECELVSLFVSLFVSWCIEPSLPHGIILGMNESESSVLPQRNNARCQRRKRLHA